ncbi:hypothetical protein Tco_1424790 [Tanacetum coccineum]
MNQVEKRYVILSTFPSRPTGDEINDAFEGRTRDQVKKASGFCVPPEFEIKELEAYFSAIAPMEAANASSSNPEKVHLVATWSRHSAKVNLLLLFGEHILSVDVEGNIYSTGLLFLEIRTVHFNFGTSAQRKNSMNSKGGSRLFLVAFLPQL